MPLLDIGAKAPAFALPDHTGETRSLKALLIPPTPPAAPRARGTRPHAPHPTRANTPALLLYFYPKAGTPSCTKQACAFTLALPALANLGVRVVGISPDSPAALAAFAKKHRITFPLLSDLPTTPTNRTSTPRTAAAFGAWGEKTLYGRRYLGIIRTTYLLSTTGRVLRRWDNVKVPTHAAAVLAALKELSTDAG
jgi:peroxiredoxin Q/BCP